MRRECCACPGLRGSERYTAYRFRYRTPHSLPRLRVCPSRGALGTRDFDTPARAATFSRVGLRSADIDEYCAVHDLCRVGAHVLEDRGSEGLPAGVVEAPVVLRALDDGADDQAIAQQGLLVRAMAVGGVVGVLGGPVDRVVVAVMRERDDVLGVDVV